MRRFVGIAAVTTVGVAIAWLAWLSAQAEYLPAVADAEFTCSDVVARSAPNLQWTTGQDYGASPKDLSFAEVRGLEGKWVRLRGILHVQYGPALGSSTSRQSFVLFKQAPRSSKPGNGTAIFLQLETLLPGTTFWLTNQATITGRCVVVEGQFRSIPDTVVLGELTPVTRLSVWSSPAYSLNIAPVWVTPVQPSVE